MKESILAVDSNAEKLWEAIRNFKFDDDEPEDGMTDSELRMFLLVLADLLAAKATTVQDAVDIIKETADSLK